MPDRVLSLLAEGIEFAVPTDHNHITNYAPAIAEHAAAAEIGSVPGVEITTATWGHFNAYPYPLRTAPPPFSGVNPIEIFATVRARAPGSVIQVNHPRMPGCGYFNRIELDAETGAAATEGASFEFDAIEVVNGYDLENMKFIEQNLREYFALLNFGRRYTATGNSDSHRLLINWPGYPRTYVRARDDRPGNVSGSEVARAVNDGHAMVSNGIFLVATANGQAGPGDTVTGSRVTLQMEARAPSWVDLSRVEVWVNGGLFSSSPPMAKPTPGGRLVWQTELDLRLDSWIVVFARGNEPMSSVFYGRRVLPFAFTNPIFVDANEDGVFRAPEAPEPPSH
ncbi:MAG: CehA/McbA family metallohydrolase [Polyangiaceae bacterium]